MTHYITRLWNIFTTFLLLGLTSFGGPIAHLAFFRQTFVEKQRWLTDADYAQLVALCQILPGPTSTQVGMAIGLRRAGISGAILAWIGFTLPSVLILILFAYSLVAFTERINLGMLHGLAIAGMAIVIHALWSMSRQLCPDLPRQLLALGSAIAVMLLASAFGQLLIILAAGILGVLLHPTRPKHIIDTTWQPFITQRTGLISLTLFFSILILMPVVVYWVDLPLIQMIDHLFRTGALVFGGGHVVLPLLYEGFAELGVSEPIFLAGYGVTQALPGPLLSFAGFLGAQVQGIDLPFWFLSLCAVTAIFLPSFLLVIGVLPFWQAMMTVPFWQNALWGINASVVGILLSAVYHPIATHTLYSLYDVIWLLLSVVVLFMFKMPLWLFVLLSAVLGGAIHA